MEITEREAKLLRYLKTHKKPISCEKLADLCGLSADTARRELGRLSVCLNAQTGCQIAGRRGQGYRLIVTQPQQVEAFFNELAKQYHWDERNDFRILAAILLCRILASAQPLSWSELCQEFAIPENQLPAIAAVAQEQLATFELTLHPEAVGFVVEGNELKKRYCLIWQSLLLASQPEAGLDRFHPLPDDFRQERRTVLTLWRIIQECLKSVPQLTLSYSDCQALIAGLVLCRCRRDPKLRLTLTDEQWQTPRDKQSALFVEVLFQHLDGNEFLDSRENRRFLEVLTSALRGLNISIPEAAAVSTSIASPVLDRFARRYPFDFTADPDFRQRVSSWLTQLDIRRAFAMPPFPLTSDDLLSDPLSENLALELTRCVEDCMRVPLSHDFKQQAAKCLFPYLKPLSTESVFTVWIISRQGIGAAGKWLETIQQLFPILTGTSALFTFKPVEFTALFQLRREASDLIWTDIPDLPGIPPENVFYFKPPRSRKKIIDSGFDPYTPLRDWLGRNFTIVSNSIRLRQKKDLPRLFDAIPVISARRSLSASAITCVPIVNQIMFLGGETAHLEKSELYFWVNDRPLVWDGQEVRFFLYYRCAAPLSKSWRPLQWVCERWLKLSPSRMIKVPAMAPAALYDLLIDTCRKR